MSSTQDIFETIYRKKQWGGRKRFWQRFFSGSGSRDEKIIGPYVAALLPIIAGHRIVDIGCGDFVVGKYLSKITKSYLGCDIARPLIEYNTKKFAGLGVEFRVLDAAADPLPEGDIVLVRQMLQHLSNAEVALIIPKLKQYRCAVITEHLPAGNFTPNIDKETGAGHRVNFGSGLVLTEPPFDLKAKFSYILCEAPEFGGIIRTTVFEF